MLHWSFKLKKFARNNLRHPKEVFNKKAKFEIGQAIFLWAILFLALKNNDFSATSGAIICSCLAGAGIATLLTLRKE